MGNAQVPGNAREAELARMMTAHGARLAGLCTALLKDAHLAQDVVQETFLRAYTRMDSFRGGHENSERAWLTRIAINLCRDQQRSRWLRLVDRRADPEPLFASCAAGMDEESLHLLWAVEQLPPRLKEAVLLRYYNGMPTEEMAQTLHISKSAAYRRLNKACENLKRLLEGWDFDEAE
ncbi:MAG: RNA polymerase sigma factor [Clostridiales bacterium]|nr:RNA polymerase sigma factor [Clostridiales bacterium]